MTASLERPVPVSIGDPAQSRWFASNLVTVRARTEGLSVVQSRARQGDMPPLHRHERDDELFQVLEGELEVYVEGADVIRVPAGDSILAPRGLAHTFRVASEHATWLLVLNSGDFAGFIEEMSRPAEQHDVPPAPAGPPTPEMQAQLVQSAQRHGITILGPPGTLPVG